MGPARQARRQAACGSCSPRCRPAELVAAVDFRHIEDALTPAEAAAILDKGRIGYEDRLEVLQADGFPSYTTCVGWLGYPDDKVRALTEQAVRRRLAGREDEGRRPDVADDVRRAGIIRDEIGPDAC